jgi:hypothetical protein
VLPEQNRTEQQIALHVVIYDGSRLATSHFRLSRSGPFVVGITLAVEVTVVADRSAREFAASAVWTNAERCQWHCGRFPAVQSLCEAPVKLFGDGRA